MDARRALWKAEQRGRGENADIQVPFNKDESEVNEDISKEPLKGLA